MEALSARIEKDLILPLRSAFGSLNGNSLLVSSQVVSLDSMWSKVPDRNIQKYKTEYKTPKYLEWTPTVGTPTPLSKHRRKQRRKSSQIVGDTIRGYCKVSFLKHLVALDSQWYQTLSETEVLHNIILISIWLLFPILPPISNCFPVSLHHNCVLK